MDKNILQSAIFYGYENGCAHVVRHILNKCQNFESRERILIWLRGFADTAAEFDSITVQKLAKEFLQHEDTLTFIDEMNREGVVPSTH